MPSILYQPATTTTLVLLLFIAGMTSSVALLQAPIAFLRNELGWERKKAVTAVGVVLFLCTQPVIFCLGHGFLDELDYWVGTLLLVIVALVEIFLMKGRVYKFNEKLSADIVLKIKSIRSTTEDQNEDKHEDKNLVQGIKLTL